MKITLVFEEKISNLDLDGSIQIATLKNLAQADLGLSASAMAILVGGRTLNDSQSLTACGVKDGDLLQVARRSTSSAPPSSANRISPAALNAAQAVQMELEHQRLSHLDADPFNPETQARIAEEIRQKNVNENYALAMEHNPEAFARVIMLYIPIKVNGIPLTAFVDSGAQSTIMSLATAQKCNLSHLIDRRFEGLAKGVGTAKIIGRVHNTHVDVGGALIMCSFTILERSDIDLLFGLDQLRKHQASIDLKENCLKVYEKSIPFLQEKDLPAHIKREDHGLNEGSTSSSSSSSSSSSLGSSAAPASSSRNHTPIQGPLSGNRGAIPSVSTLLRPNASAAAGPAHPSPSSSPAPRGPSPALSSQPQPSAGAAAAALAAAFGIRPPAAATGPASAGLTDSASNAMVISPPTATALPAGVTEDKIRKLVELGFSREESIRALVRAGGNEDVAASFLF